MATAETISKGVGRSQHAGMAYSTNVLSFLLEGVRGQTEQKGKQWFTDNLLAVV